MVSCDSIFNQFFLTSMSSVNFSDQFTGKIPLTHDFVRQLLDFSKEILNSSEDVFDEDMMLNTIKIILNQHSLLEAKLKKMVSSSSNDVIDFIPYRVEMVETKTKLYEKNQTEIDQLLAKATWDHEKTRLLDCADRLMTHKNQHTLQLKYDEGCYFCNEEMEFFQE